jgi:DNA invertase Pin-like site-specific DNA recombinase
MLSGASQADSCVTTGMKQNIVIYSRVSTDRQNHDSQLAELRQYVARRGWQNVEEIVDTISGTKNSRQGLDRLMAAVRRGKVDAVICFRLDRLGRSLSHLVQLVDEFAAHKVALIVPAQGIDTGAKNPMAEMQLGMLAVFAQFERAIIVERVNAGLAAARKRGVRLGRPRRENEHRGDVARLRAQGLTGRAIARELGTSNSNVFRLIAALEKAA